MNNGMCPERKRKNVVQLCRAIQKLMEVEDGREGIDSQLDKALDCLADVQVKMADSWRRAVEEREAREKAEAARGRALEYARANARKVPMGESGVERKKRERKSLKDLTKLVKDKEAAELLKKLLAANV